MRQLEKILKFLCGDPECVIGPAVDNRGRSIIVPARIAGNVGVFHEASERADLLLKWKAPELSKTELKAALKAGLVIPGATVKRSFNLQIK